MAACRRTHVPRGLDALSNLTFWIDTCTKSKSGLRRQRDHLKGWPGVLVDPHVNPVLPLGANVLDLRERERYLFDGFSKHRRDHTFLDVERKLDPHDVRLPIP